MSDKQNAKTIEPLLTQPKKVTRTVVYLVCYDFGEEVASSEEAVESARDALKAEIRRNIVTAVDRVGEWIVLKSIDGDTGPIVEKIKELGEVKDPEE